MAKYSIEVKKNAKYYFAFSLKTYKRRNVS